MQMLLRDEERRRAASAAARRQAEKYRWERLAQGWEALYD
jgi:glycosyltransferase involved in cell wall biosynthesis